jgi:hypothetical protein
MVFGIIGCSSTSPATFDSIIPDSTPTKFEGIWGHLNPESENAKIIFTGNTFSYQWNSGSKNGRFSFNSSVINFLTDEGSKWQTSYKISNGQLTLAKGEGVWWWYGAFTSNVVKVFQETDTSDVAFLVAKQLADDAARLFFYDIDNDGNLDKGSKNILQGSHEAGGVCSDYAMELAYLADQKKLENYVVFTGYPSNNIGKTTKWLDAGIYNFRVRKGKGFGSNNNVDGHYDGVLRDADLTNVREYSWDPPHPYGDRPPSHMWNIVIIDGRMFVIDATYFDAGWSSGCGIIEVNEKM